MSNDGVMVEGDEAVTVTINNPKAKNAVSVAMFEALRDTFREITAGQRARCVVLTGAGGDFAAGADLSRAALVGDGEPRRNSLYMMRTIHESIEALAAIPVPVIAKVRGVAVGAGMSLALAADIVVAADTARFGAVFARRGLSVDCGASWLLPRLVGVHAAKEIALLGDIFGAAEAKELRLINRLVSADDLDREVNLLVERFLNSPTIALSLTKRLINNSFTWSLAEALEAEAMAQTINNGTEDTAEGMKAFFEKRKPQFKGR